MEYLQRACRCPAWIIHIALVGKALTSSAAEYPMGLADAVAKLVVVEKDLQLGAVEIPGRDESLGEPTAKGVA